MIKRKTLALVIAILLCLSTLTFSGCINSRTIKTAEKAFTFISVMIGIVTVWDYLNE